MLRTHHKRSPVELVDLVLAISYLTKLNAVLTETTLELPRAKFSVQDHRRKCLQKSCGLLG
jgi:hypothetical protein